MKIWAILGVCSYHTRSRREASLAKCTPLDLPPLHGVTGSILSCNPWLSPEEHFRHLIWENRQKCKNGELWYSSSETVHVQKSWLPQKLPGHWTTGTTESEQYLCALRPVGCRVRCVQFWGFLEANNHTVNGKCSKMFHKFSKNPFQYVLRGHGLTCCGQIWLKKSAFAKLTRISRLVLLTTKPGWGLVWAHHFAGVLPPFSRSHPKFCERCRLLTCACLPTLVLIGWGLPELNPKD